MHSYYQSPTFVSCISFPASNRFKFSTSPLISTKSTTSKCIRPLRTKPRIVVTSNLGLNKRNLPNILTYLRVAFIPVIAITSFLVPPFYGQCTFTSAIFIIASITDFFDGYLARRWNVISPIGIFLDPVADKLLVALSLIVLTARFPATPYVTLSTAIIIIREIFVSALREWMAIRGKSAVVKVSILGKLKTATQMIAIALLLATPYVYCKMAPFGFVFLVLSTILTVLSAAQYIKASIQVLQ